MEQLRDEVCQSSQPAVGSEQPAEERGCSGSAVDPFGAFSVVILQNDTAPTSHF